MMDMLDVNGNMQIFIKGKIFFRGIILTFIYYVVFWHLIFLNTLILNEEVLFLSIKMTMLQ